MEFKMLTKSFIDEEQYYFSLKEVTKESPKPQILKTN